jgi:hypothetical protein
MPTRNGSSGSQSLRADLGQYDGKDYTKSKDLFDKFITRQEAIEGRKLKNGEIKSILINILSEAETYDQAYEKWNKEKRDIQAYNDYERKRDKDFNELPESEWAPKKPLPPEPQDISDVARQTGEKLLDFFGRVTHHQSNNSADHKDYEAMAKSFRDLPKVFQPLFLAPRGLITRLYRGDGAYDRSSLKTVASFATTPRNVGFWGDYTYKGTDIKSFEGILDTDRISKFFYGNSNLDKYLGKIDDQIPMEIGTDEDEKIVFGIKWKPNVGNHKWMDENGRKSDTFKEKYYRNRED